MELYIFVAIIAYLAFAVNGVMDKFLLRQSIPEPVVYTFFTAMLGAVVVVLIPFGFFVPPLPTVILAFVSGLTFLAALFCLFSSLKRNDASRVLPTVGALNPLFAFVFSYWLLAERLEPVQVTGIAFLVVGMLAVSDDTHVTKQERHWFAYAFTAAVFFSLSFTIARMVFLQAGFITGLIWKQFGFVLGGLALLFIPAVRKKIFYRSARVRTERKFLFLVSQTAGVSGGLLQNYAISLGSVTIVNALQGVQFIFLFFLTYLLSRLTTVLREDFSKKEIVRKLGGIILLGLGLIFII